MLRKQNSGQSYLFGIILSGALHFFCALLALILFQQKSSSALKRQEVFSVTLEGGASLGGIDLAPLNPESKEKVLPHHKNLQSGEVSQQAEKETAPQVPPPEEVKKEIDAPSVVDDLSKQRAEKERLLKLEQEKKQAEEKKKQQELDRKKAEEAERLKQEAEKKAQEDLAKKKAEEEAAKKRAAEEQARKAKEAADAAKKTEDDFESRLNNAKQAALSRFEGESVNAGGEGIGAAKLGGQGTGGGTLVSVEKRRYDILLEQHVHDGWRWLSGREALEANIEVRVQPNGTISSADVVASSGNSNFDDAVLRAVYKASPLPPPPESLYQQFYQVIVFTFKSNQ